MTKLSLACGLALCAALTACSSVPKAASTATAAPAGTTASSTASTTPKLICDDTTQTGSHMPTRICLTPEQVAERQKESQQAARDIQKSNTQMINSESKPPV